MSFDDRDMARSQSRFHTKETEMIRFPMTEKMPCKPSDLRIPLYAFPSLLGNAEMEEAAARVLSQVQEYGEWTGVSWQDIITRMETEHKAYAERAAVDRHNSDERWRIETAKRWYYILCVVTLGIYALFVAKPQAQYKQRPETNHPFTGIFLFGPRHVVVGIQCLVEKGLLRMEHIGDDENGEDIIYPTPALVTAVVTNTRPF